MSKKEKQMIGVLILITVVVIIIAIIVSDGNKNKGEDEKIVSKTNNNQTEEFVNILNDGTKLNTSDKLHETKTFDGMEISNFQLTENENVTLLLGTITNKTTTVKGGYPVNIRILDKEGKEIKTTAAYITKIEPGESTQLNTSATFDYANAYDFEITKR